MKRILVIALRFALLVAVIAIALYFLGGRYNLRQLAQEAWDHVLLCIDEIKRYAF